MYHETRPVTTERVFSYVGATYSKGADMERLRAELEAAIEDAEQSGDLVGHVRVWLAWAEGRIDTRTTFGLARDERRGVGRDAGTERKRL